MNVTYTAKARRVLDAKMAELRGRGAKIAADGISDAVARGNTRDRLAGKDRYGRPMTPVQPRKGPYKGASGPPLAPFGSRSRVVANFRAVARRLGGQWRITAGWEGVVSKRDVPFLPFHDHGGGRLPVRSIFGVSPATWAEIRKVLDAFKMRVRSVKA